MKGIDIYGGKINLTYKGSSTFKTMPGAFTTLVLLFIVIVYAALKINGMVYRYSPKVTKQSFQRDLSLAGSLQPFELGFDIAFGIGVFLDPAVGYYEVRHTN